VLPAAGVQPSAASSGGYLHDAINHWSDTFRSKRQRMAATTTTPPARRPATTVSEDLQCLLAVSGIVRTIPHYYHHTIPKKKMAMVWILPYRGYTDPKSDPHGESYTRIQRRHYDMWCVRVGYAVFLIQSALDAMQWELQMQCKSISHRQLDSPTEAISMQRARAGSGIALSSH
jgi:hypothetical protein